MLSIPALLCHRSAFALIACFLILVAFVRAPLGAQEFAEEDLKPALGEKLELVTPAVATRAKIRANGKLSLDLLALQHEHAAHLKSAAASEPFRPANPAIRVSGGMVTIDAAGQDTAALRTELEALGMESPASFGHMVSGRFPIAALDRLANLDSLQLARPAYVIANAGLTTTQGDVAVNADDVRTLFGVDGSGVTVGTLSDSYDCLGGAATDVANGDLPAGVNVLADLPGCVGAIDEGRAMMQLIHDLAPGSSQAFHTATAGGQADFAQGILDLANVAGSDVIVDDILFLAEPMFQDGIVAQAVDTVAGQGVTYFSSAGNSGRDSYESAFVQSGFTVTGYGEAHDFDPGAGLDFFHNVTVPVNATLLVTLQWDSPFFSVSGAPGSPNNLDIYLTDEPPTVLLTASQTLNVGGDAVEVLGFTNTGAFGTSFNVVIEGIAGPVPGLIKYVINGGGTIAEFDTNSSTIYGHANAAGAEAVGAAAYFDTPEFGTSPPLLEPFSSAGRTPILFNQFGNLLPLPVSRQKPEITCVDGGNTTFFGRDFEPDGFPNFFGTSAAAPHAAAIAALMLDFDSTLTRPAILGALESTAIDMGAAGVDDDSGHGLCQADLAVASVATGSISVIKTASPTSVPEPGANVTFTVRVDNTGNTTVSLTSLTDDVHGNLNGQGTCAVPQTIALGAFYQCSFTAMVTGNAGFSETDTVTASGTSPAGAVSDTDSATVTVSDVLPSITVTKTASPTSVPEPGGNVTFTVRVDNTSVESVTLSSLIDDVHGDLNGQGSCSVPQAVAAGGFYQCSFTAAVNGNAGDSETDTVTATANDDESNLANGDDSATVTITDVLPTISVAKAASPTTVPTTGGNVILFVRVDNTSVESVSLDALVDDVHGNLNGQGNCAVPQTIAAGGFYSCSFTVTVSGNAGDSETDTVTATASDDEANMDSANDSATVMIVDPPDIIFTDGFESGNTTAWSGSVP